MGVIIWVFRKKNYSLVPLIGGTFGAVGCALAPNKISRFWWLPLVLDPGTLLMVYCIPVAIVLIWRASKNGS
jgi:hypothetical protein